MSEGQRRKTRRAGSATCAQEGAHVHGRRVVEIMSMPQEEHVAKLREALPRQLARLRAHPEAAGCQVQGISPAVAQALHGKTTEGDMLRGGFESLAKMAGHEDAAKLLDEAGGWPESLGPAPDFSRNARPPTHPPGYVELGLEGTQISVRVVGTLSADHRSAYADALELMEADSPRGLGLGGGWLFPAGRLPRFLERLRAAGVPFKLGNLNAPTQAELGELTAGCRISIRPDPADPRFMLTEVRLPYDLGADRAARVVTGAETIPTWFQTCITALNGGGVLRSEEADELRRRLSPMEGPSEDARAQVGAQLAARRGAEGPLSEEARAGAENHLTAALSVMAAGMKRLHTSEPLALLLLDQEVSQIASPIFGMEGDDPSCGLPVWGVFIPASLAESVALDLGLSAPVEGEGDTLLLYDVLGLRGRRRITLAPPAGTVH